MRDEYAFFLGCFTPSRVMSLEIATRKVFKALGFRLFEMEGAGCCGAVHTEGLDRRTWLALAARNLCLAEEMKKDVLTPCNGCVETLDTTNQTLKSDKKLRENINNVLAEVGREFKGSIEVYHVLDILARDETIEKIQESLKASLQGVRAAVHYGCHLLRPSEVRRLDDPMNPRILDKLLEVIGVESVPYVGRMHCCGSPLRGIDDDLAIRMAREKLRNVKNSVANCMVTVCPTCFLQYDMGQLEVKMKLKEDYSLPVVHYQQLLGLALGIDKRELGFETHKVRVDGLLEGRKSI